MSSSFWLSHMIYLKLRETKMFAKLSKFTKWQLFQTKWPLVLSENSCYFENLLSLKKHIYELILIKYKLFLRFQKVRIKHILPDAMVKAVR